MSRTVLDASAVLAMFYQEPGGAKVKALIEGAGRRPMMSSVNVAEIHTRLVRDGMRSSHAEDFLGALDLTMVDFDTQQAHATGALAALRGMKSISLGDRACIALAMRESATAWTADKAWGKLDLAVNLEMVR